MHFVATCIVVSSWEGNNLLLLKDIVMPDYVAILVTQDSPQCRIYLSTERKPLLVHVNIQIQNKSIFKFH